MLSVLISDDSDNMHEREALLKVVSEIKTCDPIIAIDVVACAFDRPAVGIGPGAARNRALERLRSGPADHDVLIMFDDDMCFTDVDYRGTRLRSDGPAVIKEALLMCDLQMAVVGCEYVGRQDLSILEHIRLDEAGASSMVAPAVTRANIPNTAPGGISGAFIAVGAPAWRLPNFPEHYNEDYVWLNALELAGWPLLRASSKLAHAPPGGVTVDPISLSYQVFGEIVWLAVLRRELYPIEEPGSLAQVVNEILEQLRAALRDNKTVKKSLVYSAISFVVQEYESLLSDLNKQKSSPTASMIREAILDALNLKPLGLHSPRPASRSPRVMLRQDGRRAGRNTT